MANPADRPRRERRASEREARRERYGSARFRPGFPFAQRPADELPVGTVTFLFSDIVGSTTEIQRRGDRRAREFYRRHDALIRRLAGELDGHIVRQDGDGFFITFRSTRQGLRCAIQIQRGLQAVYADLDQRASVRIGMHVGETVEEDGDYYGTAVNLAARVRGEAGPDQILVTELVRELASGEPEFSYRLWKETELRGLEGRVRLYELLWREPDGERLAADGGTSRAQAPDQGLQEYAATLAAWCEATDLSDYRGRYVYLVARRVERQGLLAGVVAGAALDVQECFAESSRLLLIGEAGSGKTTALLELARQAAKRLGSGAEELIPAFVPLRSLRSGQEFRALLQESLAVHGLAASDDQLSAWLTAGRLLLLVDGIGDVANQTIEALLLADLEGMLRRFPRCPIALSSRFEPEGRFGELQRAVLQPLRPHDVLHYLLLYTGETALAETIFDRLGGRDRSAWLRPGASISLARNPLLLNAIIGEWSEGRAPLRARVLESYTRHLFQSDLVRGSRLRPEVRSSLLGSLAWSARVERIATFSRADLLRLLAEALPSLNEHDSESLELDPSAVLAEADRQRLLPIGPSKEAPGQYAWRNRPLTDYFVALELRQRFFLGGRLQEVPALSSLLQGDSWYRWAEPLLFLGELLDERSLLSLVESCLRSGNLLMACGCLAGSGLPDAQRRESLGEEAQRLAALMRPAGGQEATEPAAPQDPLVVLVQALIEQPRESRAASPEMYLSAGLLAVAWGLEGPDLLAVLALGLAESVVRGIAWLLGRDGRDVALRRARLARLGELALQRPAPASSEQERAEQAQAVLLALAGSPEVLLLAFCLRAQVLLGADGGTVADRRLLARDTLLVHLPLARRLRLWQPAGFLADLCLLVLRPDDFAASAAIVESLKLERRRHRLEWLADTLAERLRHHGVPAAVEVGVPCLAEIDIEARHLDSLGLPRAALYGMGRIVVNLRSESQTGRVLDVLERVWPGALPDESADGFPLTPAVARPGRHELIVYPSDGDSVRLLIQTLPDAEIDLRGSGDQVDWSPLRARMERTIEQLERRGEERQVFVLTASGQVVALPDGATPVDFAYHIHTRLGHSCTGAQVNGQTVALTYALRHGDRVRILADESRTVPPPAWLERPGYIHTSRARRAVQQAVDADRRDEALGYGRLLVKQELEHGGHQASMEERLRRALGFQAPQRMYEAVGDGVVGRRELAYTLAVLAEQDAGSNDVETDGWLPLRATGDEALRPRYARCCRPQPGDPLAGYRSGDTVVVHHAACPTPLAGPARPSVAVDWLPRRSGQPPMLHLVVEGEHPPTTEVRRAAALEGVEVLDLACSRPLGGRVSLSLECTGKDEALTALTGRLRRIAGMVSAERV